MSLNLKDWQPESEFLRALDARQEAAIEARGYERAFERAFERGFKLGLVQGVQLVVLQMLDQRFGPLPAKVAKRIDRATFAELNIWSARLLDANTLAEVFQPASRAKSSAK